MKPESETKIRLLETAVELIWESSYGSVSVDDICARADVKKGSFYYAFKSKSDLAVAAFERHWEQKRPELDQVFSAQRSPLHRLQLYSKVLIESQLQKYQQFGKILGCPFCSLGDELSTQDENIRRKAEEIGQRLRKYLESLVRDLKKEGITPIDSIDELVDQIHSYTIGVLLQAKIENNPKVLDRLYPGLMRLVGICASDLAPLNAVASA